MRVRAPLWVDPQHRAPIVLPIVTLLYRLACAQYDESFDSPLPHQDY